MSAGTPDPAGRPPPRPDAEPATAHPRTSRRRHAADDELPVT